MREEVVIFAAGHPAPGGSKNAFAIKRGGVYTGRCIVTDAGGKANKLWKQAVSAAAMEQFRDKPWDCPISVEFHFVIQRPKSHYGTGKNAHLLRPGTPLMHTYKPDLTKLIRSTEDALTGKLWVDDCQICTQSGSKMYGVRPGVRIIMREALNPIMETDVSAPPSQHNGHFERLRQDAQIQE